MPISTLSMAEEWICMRSSTNYVRSLPFSWCCWPMLGIWATPMFCSTLDVSVYCLALKLGFSFGVFDSVWFFRIQTQPECSAPLLVLIKLLVIWRSTRETCRTARIQSMIQSALFMPFSPVAINKGYHRKSFGNLRCWMQTEPKILLSSELICSYSAWFCLVDDVFGTSTGTKSC